VRVLLAALGAALVSAAPAAAQEPPVLLAAGDIAACNGPGDEATAAILDVTPGLVATLGDNAQANGTAEEYAQCYAPTWGRALERTKPAVGNHDIRTAGGAPYWAYFGARAGEPGKGWYSYDVGSWHVVVLNSNCDVVGCYPGSEQEAWLRADLAASTADCTLAYWHHTRFSSGRHAQLDWAEPFWKALYEAGADVVLSAHDHLYERHAPQTPSGDRSPSHGIRQFVVGTGGHSHRRIAAVVPTSESLNNDTYGLLKLTLEAGRFSWRFLPEAGRSFTDTGGDVCHGAPTDVVSPAVQLRAPNEGAILRGAVGLAATASDDRGLDRVEYVVDATSVARVSTAPYELTWDSRTIPDGLRRVHARAVDTTGNPTNSTPAWVVIDNALPTTTFARGPAGVVRFRNATFGFRSEPGATFECSLDRARFEACKAPVVLEDLSAGTHTFRVRARDAAGNLEPLPASRTWTVDPRAPVTRITATSFGVASASFRFAADEDDVTFACSLDGGAWTECASPVRLAKLKPRRHEFRVRATDVARNTDWTASVRTWAYRMTAGRATLTGSDASESFVGTSAGDTILGLGGDDVVSGRGGDDVLIGGAGRDRLLGGPGRDRLDAKDGARDLVDGGADRDEARLDRRLDRALAIEKRLAR
jgi:acid phosphatase type 7